MSELCCGQQNESRFLDLNKLAIWQEEGWCRVGWPQNGYLFISRNTKLDEMTLFFSRNFGEIPLNSAEGFCQNFAYFREILLLISRECFNCDGRIIC
jgi:hypothetical protein